MTIALSIAALASLVLIIAGVRQFLVGGDRRRGGLMIAAAIVTLFNIWSWGTLARP